VCYTHTRQAVHSYLTLLHSTRHSYINQFHYSPGLAHGIEPTEGLSAGSRVGWNPAHKYKQTNDGIGRGLVTAATFPSMCEINTLQAVRCSQWLIYMC